MRLPSGIRTASGDLVVLGNPGQRLVALGADCEAHATLDAVDIGRGGGGRARAAGAALRGDVPDRGAGRGPGGGAVPCGAVAPAAPGGLAVAAPAGPPRAVERRLGPRRAGTGGAAPGRPLARRVVGRC